MRRPFRPVAWPVLAVILAGLVLMPRLQRPATAQLGSQADNRFAGLQWRFARVRYHFFKEGGPQDFVGEPWYIDAPAAEQNLTRRMKTATAIQVEDPVVVALEDSQIFTYPWIYIVEPGNLQMTDLEVRNLREFMLRGGTVTFDDFHGPYEWENLAKEMRRVFPDRPIVEIPAGHPVFSVFYRLDGFPQVAGLGSFLAGRSWEKGGFVAHLRTILDDEGRPMAFINWNTDMGDAWEWSNVEQYPGYIKYSALAYRMAINEIVYALTH